LESTPFVPLLLITGLALIVPILANRFRRMYIPIVVGEIFAGIVIGHSGFDLVETSTTLTFLAEFGFAYLMFLSGLEVDFDLLLNNRGQGRKQIFKQPLSLASLILLGTIALALLFSYLLSMTGYIDSPFLLGLILSTTSLGVVVPVLKERKLLNSEYGQFLLVIASIADFVTLLLLTVVIAIRGHGLTLDLLLIPVLLLVFAIVARATQRYSTHNFLQRILNELSSATAQIRVRGAFALMVAWVVLAESLGVELILGAFLAGAIAGLISDPDDDNSKEKLDAIGYGFFIPIFFIMVGVEFNFQSLLESPQALLLVPILIVIAFSVKVLPALALRISFTWRESLAGGFLISSRLSLIIAAASIALSLGLISDAINAAVILLAVVTCSVSPMLFNRLFPPSEMDRRYGIIIVGQDPLAEFLAERLIPTGEPITVICPDESRKSAFSELEITLVTDCQTLSHALHEADGADARVLFDLTASIEETMLVCELARDQFDIPLVISRISDIELIPRLQDMGVKVVQPGLATAMALEGALRFPMIFDLLMQKTAEDIDVTEITLTNSRLDGTPLSRVRLPGDTLILSLQREGSIMIPHGDTVLQIGDRVGMLGSPGCLARSVKILRG
jgi:Kef-type K+ transport system membrane component KefB/Trk K+ transport system NAD-binding subunit